jgi:hypothetical protein
MDRPLLLSVLRLVVAMFFLASCSTQGGVYRENDPQHGEFSATRTILLPVAIAGAVVLVAAAASESSTNQSTNSSVRRHSPTNFATANNFATTNQRATVVATTQGCGEWYVAENSQGYAMLQWFGGTLPTLDDTLVGDISSFGMKNLLVNGRATKAWVEDFMLSRSSAVEKIINRGCRITAFP